MPRVTPVEVTFSNRFKFTDDLLLFPEEKWLSNLRILPEATEALQDPGTHKPENFILQEATNVIYKIKLTLYDGFIYDRWFHWFILWKQTKSSQIRVEKTPKETSGSKGHQT